MNLSVTVDIEAEPDRVWQLITDIDSAADRISGIELVEVLERPDEGLLGLTWRETRTLFGKTATETMWITDVSEGVSYQTRAESHGAVYRSKLSVTPQTGGSSLTMDFSGEAQSFLGKAMATIMSVFFTGATRKALEQDLEDIKAAAEAHSRT